MLQTDDRQTDERVREFTFAKKITAVKYKLFVIAMLCWLINVFMVKCLKFRLIVVIISSNTRMLY